MSRYETVIGLEVHVELKTQTKLFCRCATSFGAQPNAHTCPVCLGHPGALPVTNEQAVLLALRAALALQCTIPPVTSFDRKNYFYPDSPKAYQISQFAHPIGRNGVVEVAFGRTTERIRIHQVHLEEDAGKLIHEPYRSLVDLNRAGTPLIEIVTEPDLRSAEHAKMFLEQLRDIILYCGVSDGKMEEGSLRCDANVSLRPIGATTLGTKTEIKNMNSFRAVQGGIAYEVARQTALLDRGERVVQQTRRWDEAQSITIAMRSKEQAQDYRYFSDPDLGGIALSDQLIAQVRDALPELPLAKRQRYEQQYGLSEYDAASLTAHVALTKLFDEAMAHVADAKTVANVLLGDVCAYANAHDAPLSTLPITGAHIAQLAALLAQGTISQPIAKKVLKQTLQTGEAPNDIVATQGLTQIQDSDAIDALVTQVITAHPQSVADVRSGKTQALGFLVGQVMRASQGKANPALVNELLKKRL